jgi:hypothetical protein
LKDRGEKFMAYSVKMQQKICIYCKRIISFDGSWKEYNDIPPEFTSLDMKSTICPNCSFEKYPKFYGINHFPNKIGLKKKKSVSIALSTLLELIFGFLARYLRLKPYNEH